MAEKTDVGLTADKGSPVTLEEEVVSMLKRASMTLTTVESCTGGLLSARIVNVPGASDVFKAGLVTYSNKAKRRLVNVKKSTLEKYGAVSEETAGEMAEGAAALTGTDCAVSTTGIAGPGGGTPQKPVGLVYICAAVRGQTYVKECHFSGNRTQIRESAVDAALTLLKAAVEGGTDTFTASTADGRRIRIKYFTDKIERLTYIGGKSDWVDLRCAEDIEMKAGEFRLIPLGVAMELPQGYEAHVVPRSSTFRNFGIIQTNHTGIIDESYCGDNDQWFMAAYALRDTQIHVNDRICQFRIVEHQPKLYFEETACLGNADRGGHGSTGKA